MSKKIPTFLFPLLFASILALGMWAGRMMHVATGKQTYSVQAKLNKVEEVLQLVNAKYVDTVNQQEILDKVISQMLSELDPHSFYISVKDLQEVQENLEGNFEGVGIEFYLLRDTIVVVSPIGGGPSEAVGIQSGDKIIQINDTTVAGIGLTNQDVMNKLRGPKGTRVNVSIQRNGSEDLLLFPIERDKIPLFSVDVGYMVDETTGYIKINRFSATTYEEFMDNLTKLVNKGMRKLVIDVRQNPGGYLTAATMIADELLEGRKLLVYTEGNAYKKNEYYARGPGLFEKGDLIILIDQGSASASEILAGAIQDWDRGVIVGRRSFGKGLVQEQYPLRDGSALRLTVARYYTPSGRCIQKAYATGKNRDYEQELLDRYDLGELVSEDSIHVNDTVVYYTSSGRIVFGGGGIIPDVFVPIDTTGNPLLLARARAFIPPFVYDFYAREKPTFSQFKTLEDFRRNFQISEEMLEDFFNYIKKEGLQASFDDFILIENHIAILLKAHIGRQIWKNDGFYPLMQDIDLPLKKAMELMKANNLKTYLRPKAEL